jgi:hypothetical protein
MSSLKPTIEPLPAKTTSLGRPANVDHYPSRRCQNRILHKLFRGNDPVVGVSWAASYGDLRRPSLSHKNNVLPFDLAHCHRVQLRRRRSDTIAAFFRRAAVPGGNDTAGGFDDWDERGDVDVLEAGFDDEVDGA